MNPFGIKSCRQGESVPRWSERVMFRPAARRPRGTCTPSMNRHASRDVALKQHAVETFIGPVLPGFAHPLRTGADACVAIHARTAERLSEHVNASRLPTPPCIDASSWAPLRFGAFFLNIDLNIDASEKSGRSTRQTTRKFAYMLAKVPCAAPFTRITGHDGSNRQGDR